MEQTLSASPNWERVQAAGLELARIIEVTPGPLGRNVITPTREECIALVVLLADFTGEQLPDGLNELREACIAELLKEAA